MSEKEKTIPMYLSVAQFQEYIASWSVETIKRKIKLHGLPAIKDEGGHWMFKRTAVEEWFKRREVQAG